LVQAMRVKTDKGDTVDASAPVEVFEPERPSNFHQAALVQGAIDVPFVKGPDGEPYSIGSRDPRQLYAKPVCLGYAHMGMVHEAFMTSMIKMVRADQNVHTVIGESSCNLPLNRNIILQRFLDAPVEQGEYLLFLDTDIVFPPYTASALVKVAIETQADIVCVPYQLTNGCSTVGVSSPGGGYLTQGAFMWDRAYEIDAGGTGCMLISRGLLGRMKEAYADREPWPFCGYDRIVINGKPEYESDDYSLCHRAKDIGAKIVGYTGIALQHLKTSPLIFAGLEAVARGA
jgi:hypothetical protein